MNKTIISRSLRSILERRLCSSNMPASSTTLKVPFSSCTYRNPSLSTSRYFLNSSKTKSCNFLRSPSCSLWTSAVRFAEEEETEYQSWTPYGVKKVSDIIWPELLGELSEMPVIPPFAVDDSPVKQTKRLVESRGPELINNELIHKQFGVVLLDGGRLFEKHFMMIREIVNRHMNLRRFAVWRVEAPWMTYTRKRSGSRMGGGKGSLKGFYTPVRAGRILVEVGGIITDVEAQAFLADIAGKLPITAEFVTYPEVKEREAEQRRIERENINPYDWEFLLKWNMQNCNPKFMGMYERAAKGKTRI